MKVLNDLLDVAIRQEVESQALYKHGLKMAKDKEARQLLARLVEEEIRHEATLTNIKETGLYDIELPINDKSIFEQTTASHGGNQPDSLETIKTIEQVLEIALKREYRAQQVFEAAAKATDNKELKTLMENLAEEEKIHHRQVDKQYRILTGEMGREI